MKVKELIELLQKENQESDVYLSTDAEGNGYSKLRAEFAAICVDGGGYGVDMHSLAYGSEGAGVDEEE